MTVLQSVSTAAVHHDALPTMAQLHPTMAMLLEFLGAGFVLAMGWLCVLLLWKMQRNQINLSALLEEESGGASMARFQLLLFSLIVGVGLFLYMLNNLQLPDIPPSILTLLGISASTYAASKGIQFSRPEGLIKDPNPAPGPGGPAAAPAGPNGAPGAGQNGG